MINETKIQYLQRASIACFVVALSYVYFGFPFWFLHKIDDSKSHSAWENWYAAPAGIAVFVVAFYLWKSGEPTGMGTRRRFFYVVMLGAMSMFLVTWFLLPFAPLSALFNALGMILVGIASLKTRLWSGWQRYSPLFVGTYPFIFMYPLLILTGSRPPVMIGLWFIPWVLLGIAIWQRTKELAVNNVIN